VILSIRVRREIGAYLKSQPNVILMATDFFAAKSPRFDRSKMSLDANCRRASEDFPQQLMAATPAI
jgi:hypothetical protein